MGVLGYICFTPDYSELNKMLINDDGEIINDMHFFNEVQGTQSEGLAMGLVRPQIVLPDNFAEGLTDQEKFDSVLPKGVQTLNEITQYGSMFYDDLIYNNK